MDPELTAVELHQHAMTQVAAAVGTAMNSSSYQYFFSGKNAVYEQTVLRPECRAVPQENDTHGCVVLEPFAGFDVVYTYVNPAAPSHTAALRFCNGDRHCRDERFRDFGELRFSLRTVKHYGGRWVRRVFIVVAEKDHVPAWLNAEHRDIRVVTHRELFEDEKDMLPTLNSHAIESVLQRIPGLSKYFVYFNNDMLWGRQISFFDYFRPMSHERQLQRELRYALDVSIPRDALAKTLQPFGVNSSRPLYRMSIWFEPLYYVDRAENDDECRLVPRLGSTWNRSASCMLFSIAARSVFTVSQKSARRGDYWRIFSNFNKKLLFERIVGGWPSHSFAHYPRIMDRELLEQMNEGDFKDIATSTRRQRTRTSELLWTTFMFPFYAIGARRRIDADWLTASGYWRRPTSGALSRLSDISPLGDETNCHMPAPLQLRFPREYDLLSFCGRAGDTTCEKLNHHFVVLEGKRDGLYHFCMLQDYFSMEQYTEELSHQPKLFVTLNDDLFFSSTDIEQQIEKLLRVASGIAGTTVAPWEMDAAMS